MSIISFNTAPYFDDFNEEKNFVRVLFKPGRNLQVRELNTMQSIFNNQIKKFASNIFRNGARVSGGGVTYRPIQYIVMGGAPVYAEELFSIGCFIEETTGVRAQVHHIDKTDAGDIIAFIEYSGTGRDQTTTTFTTSSGISVFNQHGDLAFTAIINKIAPGRILLVHEGVYYYEGHFINNPAQSITVGLDLENTPCKIGFDVIEEIVDEQDDPQLLDNAIGYYSFNSPGAARYKITLGLTKRSLQSTDGDRFIVLLKINERGISYIKKDTEYSVFGDYMAKRTYEESGNYTIKPFDIVIKEHKAKFDGDPLGYDLSGDPNKYVAIISPNVAYVEGYRVELPNDIVVISSKGSGATSSLASASITDPSYFIATLTPASASFPNNQNIGSITLFETINLYSGPIIAGDTSGVVIGSAQVISCVPQTIGFKYFISNIVMLSGSTAADVKSMKTVTTNFIASLSDLSVNDIPACILDLSLGSKLKDISSIKATTRQQFRLMSDGSGVVTCSISGGKTFSDVSDLVINAKVGVTFNQVTPITATVDGPKTTLTIDLGGSYISTPVFVMVNVDSPSLPVKTKTASTRIDVFTGISSTTVFTFTKSDLIKINSIQLKLISDPSIVRFVDPNKFYVFNGQTATHYEEAKLTLKSGVNIDTSVTLSLYDLYVDYDYFVHSTSEGVFTINSYGSYPVADIPAYITKGGRTLRLENTIDFRPLILWGDIVSPSPYIAANFPVTFGVQSYHPHIDLICMRKDGSVYVKSSKPSASPRPPVPDSRDIGLFEIHITADTLDISGIIPKRIENKRYTMRDIGKIENRIKNMEYYTALTLLEKSAEAMSIKDSAGLDRFKNGFIADDFSKYQAGDITSNEFKAGLDRSKRELRPSFVARNRKFAFNDVFSKNTVNKSGMVMGAYTEVQYQIQPFATKTLSINPYYSIVKKGSLTLEPNNDTWADVKSEPALSFTIDSGVEAFRSVAQKSGLLNTEWGAWNQVNRTVNTVTDPGDTTAIRRGTAITAADVGQGSAGVATPAPGTTSSQTISSTVVLTERRDGLAKSVGSRSDSHSFENIKDVSITTFMRPIVIKISVEGLSPETKHYAFFGETDVTAQTRMLGKNYGEDLITDASGKLQGEFRVDSNQFFVGEKNFVIATIDDPDQLSTESNYSTASATFFAGGLDITKQKVNMNVITPTWNEQTVSDSRVSTTNNTTLINTSTVQAKAIEKNKVPVVPVAVPVVPVAAVAAVPTLVPKKKPDPTWMIRALQSIPKGPPRFVFPNDPIAQSFAPDKDMFITSINLFFASVDKEEKDFWVAIRRLDNGYPTGLNIATKNMSTDNVTVSQDGSKATKIEFDFPIFVEKGGEYCFVIGGWSPDTRVWISKVGDPLINDSTKTVETQPALGSSFRSQNGSTWNAEQFEDIKYSMNIAIFNSNQITLAIENINEDEDLTEDPFECQITLDSIRVYHKNHGLTSGDKFTIKMFENEEFTLSTVAGQSPIVGQSIYSSSGRATITDVRADQASAHVIVKVKDMIGFIQATDTFTCDSSSLLESSSNAITGVKGTVVSGPIAVLAGIPIQTLNGEHEVFIADTQDTFIFKIDSTKLPTSTGRFGGKTAKISLNTKYEVFNISASYLSYGSKEKWVLKGIGHNPEGGIFSASNYQAIEPKEFQPGRDTFLDIPYKLANDSNEAISVKAGKSMIVIGSFVTPSLYVSPVINLNTLSAVLVSNNVEWITEEQMNEDPFASTRFVPETSNLGSESYKYVTRLITLSKPATDLMIAFDVYKDKSADFKVFYKMLYAHETKNIDTEVDWIEVPITTKKDAVDLEDRTEYEMLMSDIFGVAWSNVEYSAFKIKLVGKTKNTSVPPLFQSFRAIAVS